MKPNKLIDPDMPVSKMAVINSIVLLDYKLLSRAEKAIHSLSSRSSLQKPVVLTCEQATMQMSLAREHAKLRKVLKETNKLSENVSNLAHTLNQVALDFHPRRPMPEFYAADGEVHRQDRRGGLGDAIRGKIAELYGRRYPLTE